MSNSNDRPRIVLVEDNPADVYLIEMALSHENIDYELRRFETGEEAICALVNQAGSENPDIILLDLNTPRGDGIETLKAIQQTPRYADVPTAIITSSRSESDQHRVSLLGTARYIHKPTNLDEFLANIGRAVKEMLLQRRPV